MTGRDVFESNNRGNDGDDDADGEHFTVQFGTEASSVKCRAGMTLRDAFSSKADQLGFDFSRNLTYRDQRGNALSANDRPEPNQIYVASVQHEAKGWRLGG